MYRSRAWDGGGLKRGAQEDHEALQGDQLSEHHDSFLFLKDWLTVKTNALKGRACTQIHTSPLHPQLCK